MNTLINETVLITGASSGIGLELAKCFAADGCRLVLVARNTEALQSLTAELQQTHKIETLVLTADLSLSETPARIFKELQGRGIMVDVLVNNAGVAPKVRADVLEATEESFERVLKVNLQGPYFLTQQAARWMAERGEGRIVFVTSISAYTASVNRGEYCISKAGLSMVVALYAQRLAEIGVKVFEIRPGIIRTDMIAKVEKAYEEKIAGGLLPQGRMGEGIDVAKAVRAIADGLLDYSTGQILNVDGGFSLRSL